MPLTVLGGPIVISVLSLVILMGWEKVASKSLRFFMVIPGSLVVVALGIILNAGFQVLAPGTVYQRSGTPSKPARAQIVTGSCSQFTFPDFSRIANQNFWSISLTLAIVASIESLLSLEAADRIDPYRRISSPNRELWAQGTGNMVSGLCGGLPHYQRRASNVCQRQCRWSYLDGLFCPWRTLARERMPDPATAKSNTPSRLSPRFSSWWGISSPNPNLYRSVYRLGMIQFIPFLGTVLAILFTDLLKGVLLGIAFGLFFVLRSNHRDAVTVVTRDNAYLIRLNKDTTFHQQERTQNQTANHRRGCRRVDRRNEGILYRPRHSGGRGRLSDDG